MDNKNENIEYLKKKIKIVSPDISEDNLIRALREPDKYLSTKILSNCSDTVILTAFETVKSKHEETLKLEADIKELSQIFIDFASIVENQGSIVDVIEGQVISSVDAIQNANTQLEEATILKRQLQRKKCCCAMLCMLLIVIIVGIILAAVYVQKKAHI
jgi:t-SNARE complex subunit (syntaxin)